MMPGRRASRPFCDGYRDCGDSLTLLMMSVMGMVTLMSQLLIVLVIDGDGDVDVDMRKICGR